MDLIQLYTAMLETVGCTINEQGEVVDTGDSKVVTIKGQKLVLPTMANLQAGVDKTIRFHPLMENQHAGESVVVNRYRKMASTYINTAAGELIEKLLTLVGSEALHSKIHPDYAGVVSQIGHVKESTVQEFGKIVDAVVKAGEEDRFLVKFFIKKNVTVKQQSFKRLGVVSFPLYEALITGENPYGVALGKRNRAILINVLTYIFPGIGELHTYSHGSASTLAPTIDALMGAIDKVFGAIGAKQRIFAQMDLGDLFSDQLMYVNRWAEAFGDIDQMTVEARKIPSQPGNEGTVPQAATVDAGGVQVKVCNGDAAIAQQLAQPQVQQQLNVVPTPTAPLQTMPVSQPMLQPQAAPANKPAGVAYGEVLQRRQDHGMFGSAIGKQYPQAVAEQMQAMQLAQMRMINPNYGVQTHVNPYAMNNVQANYVTAGNVQQQPVIMQPAGINQPY